MSTFVATFPRLCMSLFVPRVRHQADILQLDVLNVHHSE